MKWMLMPLKRYADFTGRSRRKEYWMFVLGYVIVGALLFALTALFSAGQELDQGDGLAGIPLMLLGIFALGILVPTIAVQVRRFHDQDKSGWFILLGFIPYIGGIILLVFMCLPGTVGENRFGPDPKNPVDHDEVFG